MWDRPSFYSARTGIFEGVNWFGRDVGHFSPSADVKYV